MPLDKQIVIGMAGHIDHGKTKLVKSLTGKDTDSLKQEKDRGMTIDIGFAFLDKNITIIDVPGHEKFVKNMMSGASSIDIVILVIAADDGIMPQTIEHFEILKILDIKKGIIVINKIDLVESEWIDMIKEDIKALVKSSFLEGSDILLSSAERGDGIDQIKDEIMSVCASISHKNDTGIFRMHIDRVFSKSGFGTVVTGTIVSGQVKLGDTLDLIPSNDTLRVRGIQSHGENVESASCGDRAAINLSNINAVNLKRGYHLSKVNSYAEKNKFVAKITTVDSYDNTIKNNQRVRVHLGTKEVISRISIINKNKNEMILLFRLENSMVAALNDRFIVRMFSPVKTIAGGKIIYIPYDDTWEDIKNNSIRLENLNQHDSVHELINIYCRNHALNMNDIEKILNISLENFNKILSIDKRYEQISYKSFTWVINRTRLDEFEKNIIDTLDSFHKENPLSDGCNKNIILQKTKLEDNLMLYLLEKLSSESIIKKISENWSIFNFKISIDKEMNITVEKIKQYIGLNHFLENKDSFINENFSITHKEFNSAIKILTNGKIIEKLNSDLFISEKKIINIKSVITKYCIENEAMTIPEFKKITNLSRKYAVPILEYLDKNKFTYRNGDSRRLVKGDHVI